MANLSILKSFDFITGHSRRTEKRYPFLYSPVWIVMLGAMTFAAFAFSKELLFYGFVLTYGLFVIAFCDDLTPIMPLFLLCYITPSVSNNPGRSEEGLFYGTSGKIILGLAVIAVLALLARITFDPNVGWKSFFQTRRRLLGGMLVLGAAYLLSGIGSRSEAGDLRRNLVFALIQLASIVLLYLLFSATVDWESFDIDYFAWAGLVPGFVVLAELVWLYLTQNLMVNGVIDRNLIYTGWGTYNNMGAILVTAVPFAFYFAQRKRHNAIYLILAFLLGLGVVFSCSRSSITFAALVLPIAYVYTFVKAENKREFAITSLLLVLSIVAATAVCWEQVREMFQKVPAILQIVDGRVVFDDVGRFQTYREGLEIFSSNPIFGDGFFIFDRDFPQFSIVDRFSSFFPPRFHNTVVQLLASCGVVGLLAYLLHRGQTVYLLVKRWSVENAYIAFYMLALLSMSLLDCHFFNVGPTLFYSIALAVAEYAEQERKSGGLLDSIKDKLLRLI